MRHITTESKMFVCGYIAETKIPLPQWKTNLSPKSKKSNQLSGSVKAKAHCILNPLRIKFTLHKQPIVERINTVATLNSRRALGALTIEERIGKYSGGESKNCHWNNQENIGTHSKTSNSEIFAKS